MAGGVIGPIGLAVPLVRVLPVPAIVFERATLHFHPTGTNIEVLLNLSSLFRGQLCPGNAIETRVCYGILNCSINGNWATWGDWSTCSSTCVGGRRVRYRNCSNPAPSNGGLSCIGSSVEVDGTCGNATCGTLFDGHFSHRD